MDEYRKFVRKIADEESDDIILNRCKDHASIIMAALFRKAKSTVCIVTGGLTADVYGTDELITSVTEALTANSDLKIRVLSERPVDSNHPLLQKIHQIRCDRKISIQTLVPVLANEVDTHFAVADRKYYRLENDKADRAAVVQFGNEKLGEKLYRYFDQLAETNEKLR